MISFFPSPYPDELWYSVICRYHVHSGNYCAKHTLRQLYGDNFCAPSLMLCGPINTLLAQLPQGFLSAKDVVMQHTFYPYYARFFPTQRKRSTYAYVVNGNPLTVHRMGISQANGNHCSVMRYCPVCYQEDLQLHGEPYWHRSHQLPDMQICTKHRCWLVDAIRLPFLPIRTRYRRSPLRGNGRVQNLHMVQSCGHLRKVERWRRSHKRPPPSFPVSNLSYAQVVLKVLAIV